MLNGSWVAQKLLKLADSGFQETSRISLGELGALSSGLGDVAAAVLEKSARSVLFISSARAAGDAQAAARNPSLVPVSK